MNHATTNQNPAPITMTSRTPLHALQLIKRLWFASVWLPDEGSNPAETTPDTGSTVRA
jgi:hypothetical protein